MMPGREIIIPGDEPPRGKGWAGAPFVPLDGSSWTLDFAARMLDIPERDLRDLIRITALEPSGVMSMRPYRSQGRAPRAYPADRLIVLTEAIGKLREEMNFPGVADST
jgi:hypothetical protein